MDEDKEFTFRDQGESLIAWKLLNVAHEKDKDDWLRKNIFHRRCTSHGKVCNVVIDSGSFKNLISTEMLDKFKLKMETYPTSFKLSSVWKESKLKVNKHYLIAFSIGKKYQDKIWFDKKTMYDDFIKTPVNTCHLLLERPQQYDKKAIYDDFIDIYFSYRRWCYDCFR